MMIVRLDGVRSPDFIMQHFCRVCVYCICVNLMVVVAVGLVCSSPDLNERRLSCPWCGVIYGNIYTYHVDVLLLLLALFVCCVMLCVYMLLERDLAYSGAHT